jgi:hypothetical protein
MSLIVKYIPPKINAAAAIAAAAPVATRAGAEHLLEASRPLVPVDTGEMQASGKVTQDGKDAQVSYSRTGEDGYNVAARQHEDTSLSHPGGGQAHFLSQPMATEREAIGAAMAVEIRKALGL